MKKRHWIIVVLAVISCAVGVLALTGYLQSDETGKDRDKVPAIKDEESITDENGIDEIGVDETEIILDSSKKENQTENNRSQLEKDAEKENQTENNTNQLEEDMEKENQTGNSTNTNSTAKDNVVTDNITTDSDKQSGENQLEDNGKEGIESSEPIELPFLQYEGDD